VVDHLSASHAETANLTLNAVWRNWVNLKSAIAPALERREVSRLTGDEPMTRIDRCAMALAGAALLAAGSARAQPKAPDPQDLQCLVVTFIMADSKDEGTKAAGALGAFFYLGKIQGKTPGADLDKPIMDLAGNLSANDIKAYGERCGAELKAEGQAVSALGQRLQKAGQGPAAPAPN
jgi:hypothetical protein